MRILDMASMFPEERVAEMRERNRLIRPSMTRHIQRLAIQTELLRPDSAVREDAQRLSGPMDARKGRETDEAVLEYSEGVSEQLTPQTRSAIEELTAPQLSSQLRQEGAE